MFRGELQLQMEAFIPKTLAYPSLLEKVNSPFVLLIFEKQTLLLFQKGNTMHQILLSLEKCSPNIHAVNEKKHDSVHHEKLS